MVLYLLYRINNYNLNAKCSSERACFLNAVLSLEKYIPSKKI